MSFPTKKILRVISVAAGPTLMAASGWAQAQSTSISGEVDPMPALAPTPSRARQLHLRRRPRTVRLAVAERHKRQELSI
jgi:hypothetical protein